MTLQRPRPDATANAETPDEPAVVAEEMDATIHSVSELRSLRVACRDFLGGRVPASTIDDVVLALTEVGTNAFDHGRAQTMRAHVSLRVDDGGPTIEIVTAHDDVSSSDDGSSRAMPGSASRRNRGLAIVAAIADEVEQQSDAGGRWQTRLVIRP